jgi:glutamyl-tRNA reductase
MSRTRRRCGHCEPGLPGGAIALDRVDRHVAPLLARTGWVRMSVRMIAAGASSGLLGTLGITSFPLFPSVKRSDRASRGARIAEAMATPAQTKTGGSATLAASTYRSMHNHELFLVGVTHRTAPLGLRERLALSAENEAGLAVQLAALPGLREFVIINTCNRVEIYGVGNRAALRDEVAAAFCERRAIAPAEFARVALLLGGPSVVSHLLDVASGLDSQMVGENEIFGQVKKAFLGAQGRGSAGPVLNRLFQKTFQAAKHVRTHTGITSGLVSVSSVAVELALRMFGNLDQVRVLLLGAGEIGLKTGRAFRSRQPAGLAVASRHLERAQAAAGELAAAALPMDQAIARLAEFDVVVCSTSSPGTIISMEMAAAAAEQRGGRPLFFIDAALPRDVEAGVAALGNVFVYNLDDLAKIAAENRGAREAEIGRCREILSGKAAALWAQLAPRPAPEAPIGLAGAPVACLA